MKKILALLLASLLLIGLFAGCAKQETAPVQQEQTTTTEPAPAEQPAEQPSEQPENTELPTITFVHGYYHDESEWAAAAQMRQIYQDFADLHKDDSTSSPSPTSLARRASTTQRSTTSAAASSMTSPTLAAGTSFPSQARPVLSLT